MDKEKMQEQTEETVENTEVKDGQGIKDTIKAITDAGFTYEIESA